MSDVIKALQDFQKEVLDIVLFVDYAKDGKVNGLTGDEATRWAAPRLARLAIDLVEHTPEAIEQLKRSAKIKRIRHK